MTRYYSPSAIKLVLRGLTDPINSNMMRDAMMQLENQDHDNGAEEGLEATEQSADSSPGNPPELVKLSKMPAMMEIKPDLSFINVFKSYVNGSGPEETGSNRSNSYRFRLADPTSRRDFEYYRDHRHRGYLSPMVKYGESPSLYFKVPGSPITERWKATKGKKVEEVSKMFQM